MMQVTWKAPFHLLVAGHAGWAETGRDILCAAGSMLVYALTEALEEEEGIKASVKIHDGFAEIRAVPEEYAWERCCGMFQTIREGFRLLSREYPDYVQVMDESPDDKKETWETPT